jgi:ABC-2 type transport system permease protein
MKGLGVLIKKEIREQLKTYRFLIVAGVFLFFGLSTPLLIKYLPQLLELAGEDIIIELPPPTALQSLQEYSDTILQVGVLVVVLVTMGAVARERERGTAQMTLSKPVDREAFVTAKLVGIGLSFLVALGLASAASYIYTIMLLGEADVGAFFALNLLLWLFFIMAIAITLLFSCLFKNQLAAGGVALAALVGQAVLTQVPWIGNYVPAALTSWGIGLLVGPHPTAWGAVGVSLATVCLSLYLSRLKLNRTEI